MYLKRSELAKIREELVIAEDELAGALRTRRWDIVQFAHDHVQVALKVIAESHEVSDH